MKCFYHNDMDGKCSAAIVKRYYGSKMTDLDFIEMDYDRPFPFERVAKDEHVIIVDFSLQKPGDFKYLLSLTDDVVWIDHHKTAIEKHQYEDSYLDGIRDTGDAGCVLTWEHYYPKKELPKIVELLGDYDIWAFVYGDDTRNLQAGVKLEDTHPCNQLWEVWLFAESSIHKMMDNGKLIRKYQQATRKQAVESNGFYAKFEGYRCICLNNSGRSSTYFDSVDQKTYDLMLSFNCNDKGWTVTLYNNTGIDASVIAVKYGGGGHPGACGFQCKQLFIKDGVIEVVKKTKGS